MKRLTVLAVSLALSVAALQASAQQAHKDKAGEHKKAAPQTITGELVDTGCYLGHAARGAKHVACATKCIAQGMPMGLLTSNGTLYLLTINHDNADPYNQLKEMAGRTVSVTGVVMTRGGMKGIDAAEFKAAVGTTGK
ncbi:MAG: hypothetical protein A2W26_13760 [Acidobacteria bacterium RBG_16_64_8]|nr:MAG: hypothetical protein A2W26_13760 [Acidobacteria bacterium RBG_16_64_8]